MATLWEIAAHSVDNMFSLNFDYLKYELFQVLFFEAWICGLIASVPDLYNTLSITCSDVPWVFH